VSNCRDSVEIEDVDYSGDAETTDREIASSYLTPNRLFLDKHYGIRRDDDGTFIIGNSVVSMDESSDITINGKRFRGTKGLWELLTRKNVNTDVITTRDMKRYKHILEMTNVHLVEYEPGGDIQISRGSKFAKVIPKLFLQSKRRGIKRQRWARY
jgi:hypothetical protein